MKKILLAFSIAALFPVFKMNAQNMMYVDSVVIRPANPIATDPVYLHVYGWSGWGTSLFTAPTVQTAGNYHTLDFCYIVGMATVVTSIHDSVLVFTGPAGQHTIQWNITQNSQNTDCALTLTASQQLVNVSQTVGMSDSPPPMAVLVWNSETEGLFNTIPGKLSVYDCKGSLISENYLNAFQNSSIPDNASGIYLAVFCNENGEKTTLRFFKD